MRTKFNFAITFGYVHVQKKTYLQKFEENSQ